MALNKNFKRNIIVVYLIILYLEIMKPTLFYESFFQRNNICSK